MDSLCWPPNQHSSWKWSLILLCKYADFKAIFSLWMEAKLFPISKSLHYDNILSKHSFLIVIRVSLFSLFTLQLRDIAQVNELHILEMEYRKYSIKLLLNSISFTINIISTYLSRSLVLTYDSLNPWNRVSLLLTSKGWILE